MNMGWHRLIHHSTQENYSCARERERRGERERETLNHRTSTGLTLRRLSSAHCCCFLTAQSTFDFALRRKLFVSLSVRWTPTVTLLMHFTLNILLRLPLACFVVSACETALWILTATGYLVCWIFFTIDVISIKWPSQVLRPCKVTSSTAKSKNSKVFGLVQN